MKISIISKVLITAGLMLPSIAFAQLISGDIFLQGRFIEIGIASNGALGSGNIAPAAYHSLSSGKNPARLGIVADPDQDGWLIGSPKYFGDYFMSGFPQEEWDIQSNGVLGAASRGVGDSSLVGGLKGNNVRYLIEGNKRIGLWEGNLGNLKITQTVKVDVNKMFALISVKLKNDGATNLNNIYYNRLIDPDNEVEQAPPASSWATRMRIENQIPNIKQQVAVSATGFTYGTYLGLCTRDCRAKSYIINSGLTIANHLDSVYNGLGDASTYLFHNNDSLFADVSMGIVFNIGTIKAGDSTILSFAYLLKKTSIDSLFANEFAPHWAFKGREIANKDTVKACDGEVFQLGIIAPGTINWVWSASPFLSTTIGDANWVIANGTNTYRAIRSDAARCGSNDTLQITVKTVPVPMPLISKSGITLSVPNIFVHYNWYKGDTLLSSTDSNTYDLIQNGNYYVIVTDTNGCFVSSDTLYVNGFHDDVSIDELSDNDRVISYPNPCYDVINIRNAQSSTITLSDLSGRVLLSQNNASSINVSNLASGVYLLRIYNRQGELLGINKILKRSYD